MPSIIFVCTANRFRSPIAAAALRKELQQHKTPGDWQVLSAGTWTSEGMPAAFEAMRAAALLGLDISTHSSREISAELVKAADLILVMEQGHKEALQAEFPRSAHKVHLLSEAATGVAYDIQDPASSAAAEDVPGEIVELIHEGFDRICALARGGRAQGGD